MRKLKAVRAASRIAVLTLITGAALSIGASAALAAVDADLRGAVMTESNAVGVGAGVLAPMNPHSRWYFNPNVEVGFADRENLVSMNGDFHYDLNQNRNMAVWMGGGPAVLVTDRSSGSNSTDVGVNVLTGIGGTRGSVRPFGQLKGVVADNSQIVLQGGVRF